LKVKNVIWKKSKADFVCVTMFIEGCCVVTPQCTLPFRAPLLLCDILPLLLANCTVRASFTP
jgi:hypothetical protein